MTTASTAVHLGLRLRLEPIESPAPGPQPAERRNLLDSADVSATFAGDMDEYLKDYDYGSLLRLKRRCPGQMVEGQITWAYLVGYRAFGPSRMARWESVRSA